MTDGEQNLFYINFKLSKLDKYLLTGFLVSCLMIGWLSWSLMEPIPKQKCYPPNYKTNTINCDI